MRGAETTSVTRWTLQVSLALCLLLVSMALLFGIENGNLQNLVGPVTALLPRTVGHSAQPAAQIRHETQHATASAVTEPPAAAPNGGSGVIAYGDQLKITFFETLDVALDPSAATSPNTVATVFPRTDLSGDYVVDADGNVNIARLGQFAGAGKTVATLQGDLSAAFQRSIGRTSDVSIAIAERQPVYVVGAVRSAGSYKHAPGMIVLQAFAAAGGANADAEDTSRTIEAIRETERLRQAEQRLDRLLVRQARLTAQRDSTARMELPANLQSRLAANGGHDALSAVVATETATLAVEWRNHQQQLSLAEQQIRIAHAELDAQNLRTTRLNELQVRMGGLFHEMQQIANHGSVTQYQLADADVKLAELSARQQELRAAVAQAERHVTEAEGSKATLEFDYAATLEHEIAATQQEMEDCSHEISSMRAVTQVLGRGGQEATKAASFRITRRAAGNVTVFFATEDTPLLPGDVLEVSASEQPPGSTSGIAQATPRLQD